ncbi:MAG TPA: PQQ-binding-like beta-propeller repeat protein [Dehalococcoidia bacterium]|nr:PQQ-binding-like beta-propeller repeat protein [Dehalococcoidia bacterium]
MELDGGDEAVLLGTSRGLYIISQGVLLSYIPTPNSVMDIALLDDLTGDYQQDIVIAIWDTYFPNIRCYDSDTGDKLWQFIPKQEVFIDNLMWTELQTPTFNLENLDVNGDDIEDVVATSGYRVYAIDGRTGSEIWACETSNNLWRIAVTADFNADGSPDLAVGGQNGYMYVLSSESGELLWGERVAERYDVINDRNEVWTTVDRSIWDILPVSSRGNSKAAVSSEDGKVRLIDLSDGTTEWEVEVVTYITSLQYDYYRQNSQKPTSPGDRNFFNIRLLLVDDISGDGIEDVLASTHIGEGRSGLFMINGASGLVIWQKPALDLGNIAQIEEVSIGGERVVLLPKGKTGFVDELDVIDLNSGTTLETIEIESGPESTSGNVYRVRGNTDDEFILASDYGDLLLVSAEGDVLWDYPRVTDVAVERGDFCGDASEDLLVRSETYPSGRNSAPTARVLYVVDGGTREKVWTHEVPYEVFVATGGISNIHITPDLNGDGKQDIAGYIQIPESKRSDEEYGDGTRIILLSGKDGTVLLKQPVVSATYYGVWDELYDDPSCHEDYIRQWYEQELQRQLDEIEKNLRQQGIPEAEIQQRLNGEEAGRRQGFEENELPQRLEELQRRLEDEEKNRRINKWILSFGIACFDKAGPAPVCLLVKTPRDMYLLDPSGEILLTWTFELWMYQGPFENEPELPAGVKTGLAGGHWNRQLVLDDINDDGGSDLVIFANNEIYIVTTDIGTLTGSLDYETFMTIEVEEGIEGQRGWLGDDLDGDGIREFCYYRHQEGRPSMLTFMSPVTGEEVLEMEYDANRTTIDTSCADFDGDGCNDTLLFQRWVEDKEGPKLEILSGQNRAVIWEYNDYREGHLFNEANYQGSIKTACPISDISGDGVADLALIRTLTWQPGAQILLYDVNHDSEIKCIVLEEIDSAVRRDQRWHPGFLVEEITDVNGDGTKELVAIMAFGNTAEEKEWQLMVVDVHQEQPLADFRIIGSDCIELETRNEFGMTGFTGEVYLLDVACNLQITAPADGSTQTSPTTVEWVGTGDGAFNQVFIDGIEVGRTNDNELTIPTNQGEHELELRSLDEYGRGIYQTVTFSVEKSSSAVTQLIIWLAIFLIIALVPVGWGFIIRRQRRKAHRG